MTNKFWLLGGCLLSFIIFLLFEKYISGYNFQASLYILSSITQGLAALLAILLTATLIVVQVFRRFTAWKIALSFETISLIVIYSIGIISPLVFLRIGIESWMLNLSISLMFLCIFALIPFLIHIGLLFINPVVLGELEQNILEAKEKTAWGQVINLLQDFHYAWQSVIISKKDVDMEAFNNAWDNIRNHISSIERVQYSLFNITISITSEATKRGYEDYARHVYLSHYILGKFSQKFYDNYKSQSIRILKIANKKQLTKLSECIILQLRRYSFSIWHRFSSKSDRDHEPKSLIKDLIKINPQLAKDTLKKQIGNKPIWELFAKLLEEIEASTS